jgi:hypothetical protein
LEKLEIDDFPPAGEVVNMGREPVMGVNKRPIKNSE